MTADSEKKIPRWASAFKGKWERINELLYEGRRPCDVMRELKLPERCKSSFRSHAWKYRNRRVLAPLTTLRELIVRGAAEAGPSVMKAIQVMLSDAIREDGDPDRRDRAIRVLLDLFDKAERSGRSVEEAERQRVAADTPEKHDDKLDPVTAFRIAMAELGRQPVGK